MGLALVSTNPMANRALEENATKRPPSGWPSANERWAINDRRVTVNPLDGINETPELTCAAEHRCP
jgi:hypothetical protein